MELRGSSTTHSELFESKSTPPSNIFDNELWTGNTTKSKDVGINNASV